MRNAAKEFSMKLDKLMAILARPAIVLDRSTAKGTNVLTTSWFGKVLVGGKNENWPLSGGLPMIPLCQVNVKDCPYKLPLFRDIAFFTVFIDPSIPRNHEPNGAGWLIRTY